MDPWAEQWTAAWAASAERFNKMHGAAGSGHGGQFVSSSGGSGTPKTGTKTAKAPRNVPHHPVTGPATPGGGHAERRRRLTAQIHADEAKITTLEHELRQQEKAMHTAASQAAHSKAQAAASARAGHHKAAAHHTARHSHHRRRHLSHRQRITQIRTELHKLRTEVKGLRAQVAKL